MTTEEALLDALDSLVPDNVTVTGPRLMTDVDGLRVTLRAEHEGKPFYTAVAYPAGEKVSPEQIRDDVARAVESVMNPPPLELEVQMVGVTGRLQLGDTYRVSMLDHKRGVILLELA